MYIVACMSCGHGKHLRTYYSWISMFIFNPYFCCFVSNKTFRCKCKSFRLIWILIPTLRTYSYHFFSFHCEIKWSSNIVMNKTHLMLDLIHSYIFVHILCWFTMLLWHLALCCGSSVAVSTECVKNLCVRLFYRPFLWRDLTSYEQVMGWDINNSNNRRSDSVGPDQPTNSERLIVYGHNFVPTYRK